MSTHTGRMTDWLYRGLWGALTRWFRVPDRPPTLPTPPGETAKSFKPARGFLRYMKLQFWLGMAVVAILLLIAWIVTVITFPTAGLIATPFVLLLVLGPGLLGYLAVHLRYDTTWYVMTSRSLRIRRGIWVIRETTITFENIQNVNTNQGPIQRLLGIADLRVDTAGGGGHAQQGQQGQSATDHQGLIEGIDNPQEIRDAILIRLRRSRTSGLGDEDDFDHPVPSQWTAEQLEVLRDIRDVVHQLTGR